MQQVNSGTAYILWCLCFVGICGGQRFYTGNIAMGLIYFFTVGLCGVGQLLDLALIPGMVDKRNVYLRSLHGGGAPEASNVPPQITINIGDIPQLKQFQSTQPTPESSISPMQKLLRAAKENGGQLSVAQAVMYTEIDPQEVKQLLQEAEKNGLAEIGNDPNTGAVRYYFEV